MISFSCSHCGLKLKVKPEFAGRSSKCPTCKTPLVVPQPDRTEGHVPKGEIDGTPSSVHQAGVDGGVTLGQKSVHEILSRHTKGQRYIIQNEIARGGMGAVLLAIDCDLRREVAVKFMLDHADAKKKLRFMEEAQITGQLEHPNIVPIHELGLDAQKRMFFTMKMVRGRSLKEVVDQLRENPKTAEKEYSLGRLLNIFVNVCNGLAYAHSRGVVHRDLKPANIMTGDFGEVYVMDWGLAKVLKLPEAQVMGSAEAVVVPPSQSDSAKPSSKVVTSREPEADLTQEGAIVGTPVYMPPEQAMGEIGQIDQRSDVYSLGAILYEMLTLQPPIDKEGGYMSILMRVVEGDIKQPEQRSPARAISRELSAIAMKALAKEKKDRYQDVEALRRDIERFQEGRSVSAKEDTFREAVWKLVKRNKGASATACTGLFILAVVVGISFSVINNARLRAEEAKTNLVAEKEAKRLQAVNSVPAYMRAANLCVNQKQFDDALAQVDIALEYDQGNADAQLLKGKVLIVKQQFKNAAAELQQYLQVRPKDQYASKLIELCRRVNRNDPGTIAPFVDHFLGNQEIALGIGMGDFRDKILAYYRERIEKAWAGLGDRLKMDTDGTLDLNLDKCGDQVTDLVPLQGVPLTKLSLSGDSKIKDLTPLTGMPLITLNLTSCIQVRDLMPLKGMPLTTLSLYGCVQVADLTPLKGMPLTTLNLTSCIQVRDLMPLQDMPLTTLTLGGCRQIKDLTPLKGKPFTSLSLTDCQVTDLTPLQGMPLTKLYISTTLVHDLKPLQGMPLTTLHLHVSQVQDLSPLQGMELEDVLITPKHITKGMDVLRKMNSVKSIGDGRTKLPPKDFWKKYDAGEFNK